MHEDTINPTLANSPKKAKFYIRNTAKVLNQGYLLLGTFVVNFSSFQASVKSPLHMKQLLKQKMTDGWPTQHQN